MTVEEPAPPGRERGGVPPPGMREGKTETVSEESIEKRLDRLTL
jgi:hypothetical protein